MNWRERLADWIAGGLISKLRQRLEIDHYYIAVGDELVRKSGDPGVDGIESRNATIAFLDEQIAKDAAALRSILTARNITEARKIARQALGEAE